MFRPKKKWAPRESRMVAEYVNKQYAGHRVLFRPRLGAPPPELAARIGPELAHAMLKPWYKYPDCVIFLDRELRILEGKIHRPETAIGQLLDYAELIRQSPDFSDYRSWRVSLELVTPWDREDLRRICKRFGIIYTVYVPEWLHDYLELYQHYWSREYRLIKGLKSSREGGAAWP